jgi:hypothetical protein
MVRQRNTNDAARMRENRAQRTPTHSRFASSAVRATTWSCAALARKLYPRRANSNGLSVSIVRYARLAPAAPLAACDVYELIGTLRGSG